MLRVAGRAGTHLCAAEGYPDKEISEDKRGGAEEAHLDVLGGHLLVSQEGRELPDVVQRHGEQGREHHGAPQVQVGQGRGVRGHLEAVEAVEHCQKHHLRRVRYPKGENECTVPQRRQHF